MTETSSNPSPRVEDAPSSEPRTLGELKQSLKNFGTSAHQMVTERVQNFRSADGNKSSGDLHATSIEESLSILKNFMDSAKSNDSAKGRPQRWNFATAPLAAFDKTLDDLLTAFILWARDDDETSESYNVSKAYRRLEGYASWMDSTGRDLIDPPLTTESLKEAFESWNMVVSKDNKNRLVWFIDFSAIDEERIKNISPTNTLRLFVWLTHYLMFNAEENGMVVVQNLANFSFWKTMTLMPPQLGMKIDRFTISVLPIQMKHYYLIQAPWWTKTMVQMTQAFLSKKMKERISVCEDPSEVQEALGAECIPATFSGCQGTLTQNIVAEQYFA